MTAPNGARLRTLATTTSSGLRVYTASGTKTFIAGVNLGATRPGFQPGELDIPAATYARWFAQMGGLGIRSVRIYTIHRPQFYSELRTYNLAHPTAPIYLVQGVYLPDETYLASGTLYDPVTDNGFAAEIVDAQKAVRGKLTRAATPGRASGTWTADVTPWLLSWIVGVEWDPYATERTDALNTSAPAVNGTYFRSTPGASPTERWIAKHLNALAALEAARGATLPIAFANWPSMDPLTHPTEPWAAEDLPGVDANHVLPTTNWPGGSYASYHAYPYYPDFLRDEPGLQISVNGKVDPYAGYLTALRTHHAAAGLPVMITETGVPSSLGSAHSGPLGRDQGDHTELEAGQIDAELMRLARQQGMAGVYLFTWQDEWFKFTWNTINHQSPRDRRQLWHDPLTNEQNFGLLAADPSRLEGVATTITPPSGPVASMTLDADQAYLYATVTYRSSSSTAALTIDVDTVPGTAQGSSNPADYRIVLDPAGGSAQALVRSGLAPGVLDTWESLPDSGQPWQLYRLVTNRTPAGSPSRLEVQDVGALVRGDWSPASSGYDSLATWQFANGVARLRVPWAMLGLSDPSSRTALTSVTPGVGGQVGTSTFGVVSGLGLAVSVGGTPGASTTFSWPTWTSVGYTERLKRGALVVGDAYRQLNL